MSGKSLRTSITAILLLPVAFVRALFYGEAGSPYMPGTGKDAGPESQRLLPEDEQASDEDRERYGAKRR